MQDVSKNDGRTVLFVSHNMEAVQNLCSHALLMQFGRIILDGDVVKVIGEYINRFIVKETIKEWSKLSAPGNEYARLLKARVYNPITESTLEFDTESGFTLEFEIDNQIGDSLQLDITYHLFDERGILVYVGSTASSYEPTMYTGGIMKITTSFPPNILNEGIYTVGRLLFVQNRGQILTEWNEVLSFEILPVSSGYFGSQGGKEGVIKQMSLPWEIKCHQKLV
jgi:lipopolysaccharide transport system ATP-binding protein